MNLSICIPTYNRAKFLNIMLDRLTSSIDKYNLHSSVEIIVGDNCSTDNTANVLRKYTKRGVKSYRNKDNLGPDGNFLKLFQASTGKYTWLLGDDDSFGEDLLELIVMAISEHDFDYLYLKKSGMPSQSFRSFRKINSRDLLKRSGINVTFISSQIVKTSLVQAELPIAKNFANGMAYFFVYLNVLHASKFCLISSHREIFADESGNTGGYSFYKVWGELSNDAFRMSRFGHDEKLAKQFKDDIFFYMILPMTLYLRRKQRNNFKFILENPEEGLVKYYGNFCYKTLFSLHYNFSGIISLASYVPVKVYTLIRKRLLKVDP